MLFRSLPNGAFVEVHQPLGPIDADGNAVPLEYAGARVPKQLNELGFADAAPQGSFFSPDDPSLVEKRIRIQEENAREEHEMFTELNRANYEADRQKDSEDR